jgi:hypothetical protein
MKGQDRQSEGQYGFARGSKDQASMRLVHSNGEADGASADPSTGFHRPNGLPAETSAEAVEERWIVRPKQDQPEPKRLSPLEMKASDILMPGMGIGGAAATTSSSRPDGISKRWLAVALAASIYIFGLAGLWSMVQSFDEAVLLPVTPAGDEQTVPPIEETIDVRDARLDGFIRPAFRPNDLRIPSDVAQSQLQDKS